MKKRAKSSKSKVKQKNTKYLPISKEERLEHMIAVSEQADTGHGTSIDDFFKNQAKRLRSQLEDLRKK